MKSTVLGLCLAAATAAPAVADFTPVQSRDSFLQLVSGKELRLALYGIKLQVAPTGDILGKAAGWDIKGNWSWQDGYFCREMDWSGTVIPYNCQLVEANGADRLRFTVDRGAGQSATFTIR